MSDVNIFRRQRRGQSIVLLVPETEAGRKYLHENFIATSDLFESQADYSDLEEMITSMKAADLTVEVY